MDTIINPPKKTFANDPHFCDPFDPCDSCKLLTRLKQRWRAYNNYISYTRLDHEEGILSETECEHACELMRIAMRECREILTSPQDKHPSELREGEEENRRDAMADTLGSFGIE